MSETTLVVVSLRYETDGCIEEWRIDDHRVDLTVLAARIGSQSFEPLDDVDVVLPSEKVDGGGDRVDRHDECSDSSAEDAASGPARIRTPQGKRPSDADTFQGPFALLAQLLEEQIAEHHLRDVRQAMPHPDAVALGVERLGHLDGHERQPHGPGLRLGDLDRREMVRHGAIEDGREKLAGEATGVGDGVERERCVLPPAPSEGQPPVDGDIGVGRPLRSLHRAERRVREALP